MEWEVSSQKKRYRSLLFYKGEEEIPVSAVEIRFHTKPEWEINSPWAAARSVYTSTAIDERLMRIERIE